MAIVKNKEILTASGIVVNISPYKDTSFIVNILNTDDSITHVKLSVRSKKSKFLQPLSVINYEYAKQKNSQYYEIMDFRLQDIFDMTDVSLLKMSLILYVQAALKNREIAENIKHATLLKVIKLLNEFNDNIVDILFVTREFVETLNLLAGTKNCSVCNEQSPFLSFDLSVGGFICSSCTRQYKGFQILPKNQLYILYLLFTHEDDKLKTCTLTEDLLHCLKLLSIQLSNYCNLDFSKSVDFLIECLEINM